MAESVKDILKAFGPIGVQAYKNDLERVRATGKTIDSVRFETKSENGVDSITFLARQWTSKLEEGIGPTTKGPSREMIESLTEYATARGMENPKKAAWALAKVIQAKGDKTHRQGGRIVYSDTTEKLVKDMKKEVTKNFTTKFMQTIKGAFVLALFMLSSCGSVQTINGVRIPKDRPNVKNYCLVGVTCFGFGYYLGKNVINGSNHN